jgi:hypothetical protein
MAEDLTNIIAGPFSLFVAVVGTPPVESDDITPPGITVPTPSAPWVQFGMTSRDAPHSFHHEKELQKTMTWEHTGAVKRFVITEDCWFEVAIAELDFRHLHYGFGTSTFNTVASGVDQVAKDTIRLGGGSLTERAFMAIGSSPEGGSRILFLPKVVSTEPTDLVGQAEHVGIVMRFECNADISQSSGEEMAHIDDITGVAAS